MLGRLKRFGEQCALLRYRKMTTLRKLDNCVGEDLRRRFACQFDDILPHGQLCRDGNKKAEPHWEWTLWKLTMDENDAGSRLAPPTRAPSSSGCVIKPLILSGFTLPP